MGLNKELIKNVLVKETENLSDDFSFYIDEDYIIFSDEGEQLFDYNIYKLAFKCKEWALDKGYTIESHTNRSFISKYNREYFSVAKIFKETDSMRINTIDESTEIKAIIKACEWILDQSKCQN